MKTKRLTVIIIAIIVLAIIGYAGFKFITQYGKQRVEVLVMPVAAQVTIDGGQSFQGPDTIYLEPGDYKLSASRHDFMTTDKNFTVADSASTVTLMLQPIGSDAIDEANSDINKQMAVDIEAFAGQKAIEQGATELDQNPVTAVLPYKNLLYEIGYKADPNDSNSVIVVIDAFQGYRNLALNRIRDLGYDPTNLKIEFGNSYDNPFTEGEGSL